MEPYTIDVARDAEDWRALWALVARAFGAAGYWPEWREGSRVPRDFPHLDLIPETTALLMRDRNGRAIATCSVTVDGINGLHPDDDFAGPMRRLRADYGAGGLGCIWRIAAEHGGSLCSYTPCLMHHAVREAQRRGLAAAVYMFPPWHVRFYERLGGLHAVAEGTTLGTAPAVLMVGTIAETTKAIERWKRHCRQRHCEKH